MTVVFVGAVVNAEANAGNDAVEIDWVCIDDFERNKLAFDHEEILSDYKQLRISGAYVPLSEH